MHYTQKEVLADMHHPTPGIHALIGDALLTLTLMPKDSTWGEGPALWRDVSEAPGAIPEAVAFTREDLQASKLLAAIWDVENPSQSYYFGHPKFGAEDQILHSRVETSTFGKADENRTDRKLNAKIPICEEEVMSYVLTKRDKPLHFIGLNLRPAGSLVSVQYDSFDTSVTVKLNGRKLRGANNLEMHGELRAGFLTRGIMETNAWFATDSRDAGPRTLTICKPAEPTYDLRLGSVVFL